MANYWFCPLYQFQCDHDTIDLEEGLKILRIPREFVEYLDRRYSHMLRTIPSTAEWIVSLPFEDFPIISNLFEDFITALRLYQKGRVVAGLLTSASFNDSELTIGGSTIWTSISSIDFFIEESIYEFRERDLPEVNQLLLNIRQWRDSRVLDGINIALGRFHASYHGPIEDRIIDQMIAFESLFLSDSQELTYKLALRTAFLLGKTKHKRDEIFRNMKKAYNHRSRIVHDDNRPSRYELRDIVPKTEEYLRQSINKLLLLLSQGNSLRDIQDRLLDENIVNNGELLNPR